MVDCVSVCRARTQIQYVVETPLLSLPLHFCRAVGQPTQRTEPHDGNCSARMSIRHPVDLAEVQDGQHVGGLVREPIGRQRHLVLVEMAPEVPHILDAQRVSQMCPRVDHACCVCVCVCVVCCADCVVSSPPTSHAEPVCSSFVRGPAHLQRLISGKYTRQPSQSHISSLGTSETQRIHRTSWTAHCAKSTESCNFATTTAA